MPLVLRKSRPADREAIARYLEERWGSTQIALRGRLVDAAELPAITSEPVGAALATYDPEAGELISIDATERGTGVGTALVEAVSAELARLGHESMRVTTTNDNLDALRFYQRRGFRIAAIRVGAVKGARLQKPTIPLEGQFGIPIRDEIDLVLELPQG